MDPSTQSWIPFSFNRVGASLEIGFAGVHSALRRPPKLCCAYLLDLAAHLQFHLRHEIPHLEFLSRLFRETGPAFIQSWVAAEPTGQYARRAAFLYEWLTDNALDLPTKLGGNYVDVIDDAKLMAASPNRATKFQRWRVNDNLPGTRHFCPIVVKTDAVTQAANVNVPELFGMLTAEFGEDLLLNCSVRSSERPR